MNTEEPTPNLTLPALGHTNNSQGGGLEVPRPAETARVVVHSGLDRQVPPSAWKGSPCLPLKVELRGSLCHSLAVSQAALRWGHGRGQGK